MKIIGIDPGYDRLGIAVVERSASTKQKETVIFSECFETSPKQTIYERFKSIGLRIGEVLDEYEPDALAIENLFITKNQKTAMRVSEARGIIIYEAVKRGMPVFEYSPMQIKVAVTGDGASDKSRMMKMVRLLVKFDSSSALDDEYDAIAVALSHIAHSRSDKR